MNGTTAQIIIPMAYQIGRICTGLVTCEANVGIIIPQGQIGSLGQINGTTASRLCRVALKFNDVVIILEMEVGVLVAENRTAAPGGKIFIEKHAILIPLDVDF